ncbi:MAG: TonB family protein [Candidatus Sulfotelmatobacter sp.]
MAYQALLFCPDEKTARTVTQVLSELDFTVAPCTEPFAAVKRLMAEHFDAIVVDCDNEQNATLLFKSAHNSANNQSSLAVAVVEGQAGVAKAFRIGANLVLTKPINVEQAKGTLRVARGLLRKGEAAKPSGSPVSAPAAVKPAPPRPAPRAAAPIAAPPRTATPMVPAAPLPPKPRIPAPTPIVASVDSSAFSEADEDILDAAEQPSPVASGTTRPATDFPSAVTGKDRIGARSGAAMVAAGMGAASAPARAREPQVKDSGETILPASLPEHKVDKYAEGESTASTREDAVAAPSFTFGGNATESSGGASKKAILGIVAAVLVAAAAYAAWTQFHGKPSSPVQVVAKPAAPPAVMPAPTPAGIQPGVASPAQTSAPPAVQTSAPAAAQVQSSTSSIESKPAAAEDEDSTPESAAPAAHGSAKSAHSPVAAPSKATTPVKPAQQPIVIKNNASPLPPSPASTADVPAPSPLAVATPGSGGSLPNFIANEASAPRPVLQKVNVSQGVSQGLIYKRVQPTYPPSALRMRVEGSVELVATVSAQGDITSLKVLRGTPLLAHAAEDAVKQWKYKPYLLDGKPVDIQTQITVIFKLPQ